MLSINHRTNQRMYAPPLPSDGIFHVSYFDCTCYCQTKTQTGGTKSAISTNIQKMPQFRYTSKKCERWYEKTFFCCGVSILLRTVISITKHSHATKKCCKYFGDSFKAARALKFYVDYFITSALILGMQWFFEIRPSGHLGQFQCSNFIQIQAEFTNHVKQSKTWLLTKQNDEKEWTKT